MKFEESDNPKTNYKQNKSCSVTLIINTFFFTINQKDIVKTIQGKYVSIRVGQVG